MAHSRACTQHLTHCCVLFLQIGSNVQALQTTATFDPVTDEFIINTPNDGAIKWWIGNAALHGKFATVFARLILPLQGNHICYYQLVCAARGVVDLALL
jgi:hypothetical protein